MSSERTPPPEPLGVRERTRRAILCELSEAALRLSSSQGFEQTTVEQIAAAVGVSGRTFHRYFDSKEDAVLGDLDALGAEIQQRLAARPRSEPLRAALRQAVEPVITGFAADPQQSLQRIRLTQAVPALRARHLEKHASIAAAISEELARRWRLDPDRDLGPRLTASVALAALDAAVQHWAATGAQHSLAGLVDEAFASIPTPPRPTMAA